jgi:hypothetical protein
MALVAAGVSANRTAVALKTEGIRSNQGPLLGKPFPSMRTERKKLAEAVGTNHSQSP